MANGHCDCETMKDAKQESLWNQFLRAFDHWLDGESEEETEEASEDPTLLYHLMFIAPLVIGFLAMARRTVS
ncbi:MAG TPA: hypothetical protein VM122_07495 [Usitatibacter sp.]|nr:hypothetical protein [Usitatibacter sp.]